jgi:hypothetical protein
MATITGTTVNAYTNALEWPCFSFDKNTLIIKNTDAANALKLKVSVLADENGMEYPLELSQDITESVLSSNDVQLVRLTNHYHSIFVAMKSNVLNTPATFQIDYIGGLQQ